MVGGPGVFIGYKQKSLSVFLGSFIPASLAYAFCAMMLGPSVHRAIIGDFESTVLPILCLHSLPIALFIASRERSKTHLHITFKHIFFAALGTFLICLLIAVPFTFGGMLDYNHRADTSLPEVISMKIVFKEDDEDLGYVVWLEAPDTDLFFSVDFVGAYFYVSHDVGDWVNATVHKGALGYPWLERYSD